VWAAVPQLLQGHSDCSVTGRSSGCPRENHSLSLCKKTKCLAEHTLCCPRKKKASFKLGRRGASWRKRGSR